MRRITSITSLVLALGALPSSHALAKGAQGAEETSTRASEGKAPRDKGEKRVAAKADAPAALPKRDDADERGPEKKSARAPEKPGARAPADATLARSQQGKSKGKKEAAPCFAPEVHVVRKRGDELETRDLHLTFCDGSPNPSALDSLSVLARPRNVERPFMPEIKAYQRRPVDRGPAQKRRRPEYLSEQVMRVHPGLLVRLQKLAERYPGRTIEIISGHRPDARDTSRHHHGRALDLRVEGISREALRDFARTFAETGVGYYPNGYFVHIDVRDDRGYWVDRSGPGEAADYGPWPPRKDEIDRTRDRVIEQAVAELTELREPDVVGERDTAKGDEPRLDAPPAVDDEGAKAHGGDELTREEIARIRAEALKALEGLEVTTQDP